MTAKILKPLHSLAVFSKSPSRTAFSLLCIFLFLLILKNPELAVAEMSDGLRVCASVVIPSIFPLMVLSEMIVSLIGSSISSSFIQRPFRKLFGINGSGAVAMILGYMCGFPIGAKCSASLYRRGAISKKEYERLLCFCNVPGPAFLISTVGFSTFGNKSFGIALYCTTVISSVIFGIITRLF